jgi:hypothetical protein
MSTITPKFSKVILQALSLFSSAPERDRLNRAERLVVVVLQLFVAQSLRWIGHSRFDRLSTNGY